MLPAAATSPAVNRLLWKMLDRQPCVPVWPETAQAHLDQDDVEAAPFSPQQSRCL